VWGLGGLDAAAMPSNWKELSQLGLDEMPLAETSPERGGGGTSQLARNFLCFITI